MAIDKKINYEIQGGVKNYKPSKMVTVPKIAKSSPDTPTAKLAYITPEEEKILIDLNLYGSLKGKPNRGPGGIPSLEGDFGGPGGFGGFQGGGDYSSAETGNSSGFDGTGSGPELPPGVNPTPSKEAQDIRSAFIAAGGGQRVNPGFFDSKNTVSPAELASAKAYAPQAFKKTRGGGIMGFIRSGGLLGNLIRGAGRKFGLGKNYNEPTYDMSGINTRVYENIPGVSTNPDYYNNLDNELMLSTEATPQNTFDADTFDDTVGSSNRFMLPFEGARTIIPNPNFTGELGYEQPNIEFGGTVLKDDNNKFNRMFNINDIASLIEASKQPQGIMGIDVGQDNIAFENDLMAKLSTKGMIEYNKLKKKKLQNKATDGLTPAPTPEELDRLNELEIQKNEAALNTTAIV